jgi:hypothetical protein
MQNPMCSGNHCRSETGPVKVYSLGGGGNLILCRACWSFENDYRRQRGRDTGAPENFPVLDWDTAEPYGDDLASHAKTPLDHGVARFASEVFALAGEKRFGVWCEVWGGVTGHRAAWLKSSKGRTEFATQAEAEAEAQRLRSKTLSNTRAASFSYSVRVLP